MSRIALIGGHGKVALLAEPLLVADGHEVSAVVRNPAHAEDIAARGADPVVADVENLDTDGLTALLTGHDVVVWSAGAGGGSPARTYAVDRDAAIRSMDAARAAGISRYVMVSYFGAGPDHGVPADDGFFAYADAKSAADAYLQDSALDWTILRPSRLTLDEPTGRIDAGARAAGSVSRANVAAVIRQVIAAEPASVGRRVIAFNDGDTPIAEALLPS
ncbi:SDR family oxidoreductase [Microlunatus ginsengisoli]|uniref:SDR family oxidoreductase n=1 Tax=Microlunatus ginsengisoli TaxID=363863 RepID=A0ABP7A757_9ACTN